MSEIIHEGRTILVQKINQQLSQFCTNVTTEIKNNLSTRNVLAETILAGLLNRMEGWKLINANRIQANYPAVDLVDFENRVSVQVTSTNTAQKIDHTLEEFGKNHLEKDFERLYVVIITDKNATDAMSSRKLGTVFSGDTDIWNIPKLVGKLTDLKISVLEDIHEYLTEELGKLDCTRSYLYAPPESSLGNGFVGREHELQNIRRQLDEGKKPVVLSGLGGMGKTELAVRFGSLYPDGHVYFVRFQNSFIDTLTSLFGRIMPKPLDYPSPPEQLNTVMHLLSQCREQDLLIVDNVDADQGTIGDLMKDSIYGRLYGMPLRMILTTRFDRSRAMAVKPMPNDKLKEIFRIHGTDLDDGQMEKLIRAVNGHTLTVDLMARTLNGKGWRKVTAEDMLRAIRENTLSGEKYRKIATDYNQSQEQAKIYQHLSVVFDVSGIPKPHRDVLRCATLLPEGGMYGDTFGSSLSDEQQEALDELLNHGWLSMENDLIRIHPIIRMVCREELDPTDASCSPFLYAVLEQYAPTEYEAAQLRQCAELYSHAANFLPDVKGDWAKNAAYFWNELLLPEVAQGYAKKAVRIFTDRHPDSLLLAEAYITLGDTFGELEKESREFHCMKRAIEIRNKVILRVQTPVVSPYNPDGTRKIDYSTIKLEFLAQYLSACKDILADNNLHLALAHSKLGCAFGQDGDHDYERIYLELAIGILEKALPSDHPRLGKIYREMSSVYHHLGNTIREVEYEQKGQTILKTNPLPEYRDIDLIQLSKGIAFNDLHEGDTEFMVLDTAGIRETISLSIWQEKDQ